MLSEKKANIIANVAIFGFVFSVILVFVWILFLPSIKFEFIHAFILLCWLIICCSAVFSAIRRSIKSGIMSLVGLLTLMAVFLLLIEVTGIPVWILKLLTCSGLIFFIEESVKKAKRR